MNGKSYRMLVIGLLAIVMLVSPAMAASPGSGFSLSIMGRTIFEVNGISGAIDAAASYARSVTGSTCPENQRVVLLGGRNNPELAGVVCRSTLEAGLPLQDSYVVDGTTAEWLNDAVQYVGLCLDGR